MKKHMKKVMAVFTLVFILSGMMLGYPIQALAESYKSSGAVTASNLPSNGLDVVLVVDNSKSIWSQQDKRNEALRTIGNLAVGADINLGCVYFADHVCGSKLALTSMQDPESAKKVLSEAFDMKEQDKNNIDTNIGVGLAEARKLFEHQDSNRKRAVILFSDGINENLKGSLNYKAMADAQTMQQVQELEEEGVELYCVYLQKGRNNEDYLKQIVNYFGRDRYDDYRFKRVEENKIDTLSDEFTKIFYKVQNGMKYSSIDLSAGGKTTFYVPSMGVNKLQIFMKNKSGFEAVLKCLEDEDVSGKKDSWQDGGNAYISVENPTPGKWELNVTSKKAEQTTGTIAYYTDIKCYTQFVEKGKGELITVDDASRNDTVRIKATFFDGQGEEIALDQAAQVTGILKYVNESGKTTVQEYPMTITENGVESEEFTIEQYGTYQVSTNIVYDKFIDLTYPMAEGKVEPRTLYTYNRNDKFDASKMDGGMRFTIRESSLVIDPEGDEVTLVGVAQGNPGNNVEAVLEDGYVVVTTDKTGDVQFTLEFMDSRGQTASVLVEGKVRNKAMVDITSIIIVIIILVLIGRAILNAFKKRRLSKQLEERKAEFAHEYAKTMDKCNGFDEEEVKECFQEYQNVKEELKACEIDHEQAFAVFDLTKYTEEADYDTLNSKMSDVLAHVEKQKDEAESLNVDVTALRKRGTVSYLKRALRKTVDATEALAEISKGLEEDYRTYEEELQNIENLLDEITEKQFEFKDMLEEEITCDLHVRTSDGSYRGMMKADDLYGYYSLTDDVDLMNFGMQVTTLRTLAGGSNMIVYSYYDEETDEEGLVLRSDKPFEIKESAAGGASERVTSYVLLRDKEYRLSVRAGKPIEITVQ